MADYAVAHTLTLTDANGDTAKMKIDQGLVVDSTTVAQLISQTDALITALGAPGVITNAKVTSATITILKEKASPTGALNSEYSSVTDGARLNFVSSGTNKWVTTIPAPVPACFGATPNEEVVDPTGPLAAWITAFESVVLGIGVANPVYNGGVKVGRHARRRAQHKVA